MTYAPHPRLPFAPLENYIAANHPIDIWLDDDGRTIAFGTRPTPDARPSISEMSVHLGVARGQLHRWRRGGLPTSAADRLCVRLGVHVVEIWPEFHDIHPDTEDYDDTWLLATT